MTEPLQDWSSYAVVKFPEPTTFGPKAPEPARVESKPVESWPPTPAMRRPAQPEVVGREVPVQPPAGVVGRPLGVTVLAAFYILSTIGAILSVPFTVLITASFTSLSTLGLAVPAIGYVWILWIGEAVGVIVPALMAYGLLKAKGWTRTIARVLSVFAIAVTLLTMIVVVAVLFPVLSLAAVYAPLMVYGFVALLIVVGILLPAAIYWYMGRPNVKAYFRVREKLPTLTPNV
jgi:hypothetical protein